MNGPTQQRLLDRAPAGLVITLDNAERMAARRLVRRGVLVRQRFGNGVIGFITVYRLNA